ncbi:MAG: VWA domain-containing protein [Microthrixaceae bacterium]
MSRHPQFDQVSAEVGLLDEDAFAECLKNDPDQALSLLADLNGATDERLRRLAQKLAGRVVVDLARHGSAPRAGVGRLVTSRAVQQLGDLDLDASLEPILQARATRQPVPAEELSVRSWRRSDTALCLLVDRSGSMSGERLAAAAVAAAAVVYRCSADCSVIAFAEDAIVIKAQHEERSPEQVVSDLLRLRGFGVTNLALAMRAASLQLARSTAARQIVVALSDCRVTTGGDAVADAAALSELVILAPAEDAADACALANYLGVKFAPLAGPSSVPEALAAVLN